MDITDAFDSICSWEEQLVSQGEELAKGRGRKLGLDEGKQLGLLKGKEIGSEVGFYHGCYLAWKYTIEIGDRENVMTSRAHKAITSFGILLHDFELKNNIDHDFVAKLQTLRAKFKLITNILGVQDTVIWSQDQLYASKNMSF